MLRTKSRWILSLVGAAVVTSTLFTNCSEGGFSPSAPRVAGTGGALIGTDGDPLISYAWHLNNTGQKVFSSSAGVAGNDLNLEDTWLNGIYGQGIHILISDDGVEDTHVDLTENFNYDNFSKDYGLAAPYISARAAPKAIGDNHGTAVAGLIAAVAGNGKGARGVAPKAQVSATNFLSDDISQTTAVVVDQARGDADIFNMSWGGTQNTLKAPITGFENQLRFGVTNGRAGKGAIYVKAAGNEFTINCLGTTNTECLGNSNFAPENTNPFMIIAGALNAQGLSASYSSAGSNLWVSSFGGEFGYDSPAMVTIDRTGCSAGFATSSSSAKVPFEKGQNGNTSCSYTATFNGTSAAAPVLSGAVALILSANPSLTWRDVKYILAKTATPVNYVTTGNISHPLGDSVPMGYSWEQPWIMNTAGFPFHNWYGFGRVNVDAAVALAKSYTSSLGTYVETSWAHEATGLSLAVPDNSASGVANTLSVAQALKIESVQLRLWVTHADLSEIAVELTSPGGTKSIVVNMRNAMTGLTNYEGDVLLSNAFFQESSAGTWTLRVLDGKVGNTGTLTRWGLNFTGSY